MAEPFVHKEGWGSLLKNRYKENDKHPDLRGTFTAPCDIKQGEIMEISGWGKKTSKGDKMLSIKVQSPYVKKVSPEKATPFTDMDDEIPF